jgi:hypothetical protein
VIDSKYFLNSLIGNNSVGQKYPGVAKMTPAMRIYNSSQIENLRFNVLILFFSNTSANISEKIEINYNNNNKKSYSVFFISLKKKDDINYKKISPRE